MASTVHYFSRNKFGLYHTHLPKGYPRFASPKRFAHALSNLRGRRSLLVNPQLFPNGSI